MIDLGDWNERLAPLFADERYQKIRRFLIDEYNNYVVYPDKYDLYNCFRYTQFDNLKVVLLGQDPYHNVGQAHGLCFSVQDGIQQPPSLVNIFKELSVKGICARHCATQQGYSSKQACALTELTFSRERNSICKECAIFPQDPQRTGS